MWVLVVMMCSAWSPDGASCKALTGPPAELTPIFKSEGECSIVGIDTTNNLKQGVGVGEYMISYRCVSFADLL